MAISQGYLKLYCTAPIRALECLIEPASWLATAASAEKGKGLRTKWPMLEMRVPGAGVVGGGVLEEWCFSVCECAIGQGRCLAYSTINKANL